MDNDCPLLRHIRRRSGGSPKGNYGVDIVAESPVVTKKYNRLVEGLIGDGYKGLRSGKAWGGFFGRILLGAIFISGGMTKLATEAAGKMATRGFLSGANSAGPLAGFYHSLAGNWTVEYLVVFGELLIGISLCLGLFTRVGAISGMLQMLLFFLAVWPSSTPLLDIRVFYAGLFFMFFFTTPGRFLGVDGLIEKFLPKKLSKLKLALG